MKRVSLLVAAASLVVAAASASYARRWWSFRVSARNIVSASGPVAEHPGAAGFALGHLFRAHCSLRGHPGASGFAPGVNF